jgi:predicted ATP-binding protein involved in virulence
MFPNIQFIVTTHSPFVITSIDNAVVYDLENKKRIENPIEYSYESIIEHYLGASMYSAEIEKKFNEYKELIKKENRTETENERVVDLTLELSSISAIDAPELAAEFYQIQRERLYKNDKAE